MKFMTRNHWMMLGFFLAIAGMVLYAVSPGLGRLFVWVGVALAWLGLAVALERKPWSATGKRALQSIVGAAAFAIVFSATRLSILGVGAATLLGFAVGAFAAEWSVWISKK